MRSVGNKDPLQGITLEALLARLVDKYGWEALGQRIRIKCFLNDPSIKSSLTFLRKTPWARQKVERLFLQTTWPAENVWAGATATADKTPIDDDPSGTSS